DFDVENIYDGERAIKRLDESEPSLVVLDLHIPLISGRKVFEHIKRDERLNETRVMIATADPHRADWLREQADLVLVKPVSFDQLAELASRLRPADLD
ncbi:MAG: response regulator, partial [Chloroflexota bacterium]